MKSLKLLAFAWIGLVVPHDLVLADEAPATQPSMVTLHLDSLSPQDAMAEFTKQTGTPIEFWPPSMFDRHGPNRPPESISVSVDSQPFWVALDALCGEAKLRPSEMNQAKTITMEYGGDQYLPFSKRPSSVSPNATFVVQSINRNNQISFQSDPPQEDHSCNLSLEAYVDPRLHIISHDAPTIESAVDESGKSVAHEQNNSNHGPVFGNSSEWKLNNLTIPLDYDPQASHKLADLKGSVRATVVTASDKLEIDDLQNAQDTEKQLAGMDVSVHDIKPGGNAVTMTITLNRGDMDKDAWNKIPQTFFQHIRVLSAEDKVIGVSGGGGGGGNKLEYTITANAATQPDKAAKLILEVPTKTDEIELPFEFKDLTLP